VLVILSAVVPGGARGFMALLGAIALCFGLVVLIESTPNRLNHWLGVVDRNGVFYAIVGGVLLLAAILSPVYTTRSRRHIVRDEQRVVA
jgi:membrane-bound ClpP family serine protease